MDRCPHINSKGWGDEVLDWCMLSEKPSGRIHPCMLISGETCRIWEEIQEEWDAEYGEHPRPWDKLKKEGEDA